MLDTKLIGTRIIEARKRKELSQAALAEKIFISPQAIGKWERGESMPDILMLNRLAEILEVDLNFFYDKVDDDNEKLSEDQQSSNINEKEKWNFSNANWVDADFSGIKNLQENVNYANMSNCKFVNANLSKLIMLKNNIENCDFSSANLSNNLINSNNLSENVFNKCLFTNTMITSTNIEKCDFSSADLSNNAINHTNLSKNIFNKCLFANTMITSTNIEKCDFSEANFKKVKMKGVNFEDSVLKNIKWELVSINECNFLNIIFEGLIENCQIENCEFYNVTFKDTTILNSFFKYNGLTKNVKFINCKVDKITHSFLLNNKVDMSGITLIEQEQE
jgi:uncharacterized protein YjbI with pentapeptide repeats